MEIDLDVPDGLEFQAYSAYLDGYAAGAAVMASHLKKVKLNELAGKARAKAAGPPKQAEAAVGE